jgi:predicted GH43/DUF377 family glycosyl hydrolase
MIAIEDGRCRANPILTPGSVKPSSDAFVVRGVFNPAAVMTPSASSPAIVLVLRVSESYCETSYDCAAELHVPVARPSRGPDAAIDRVQLLRSDPTYDTTSDSRVVLRSSDRRVAFLTSISHLRVARSSDGIHFTVDEHPLLFPGLASPADLATPSLDEMLAMEEWGVEDARVVLLEDFDAKVVLPSDCTVGLPHASSDWCYAVTYTVVSRFGAATALSLATQDFRQIMRVGVIFPPENKDVCLFPRKVRGHWYCYHRPVPRSFGNPDMWCAMSDNLVSWGLHKHILGSSAESSSSSGPPPWDSGRVGGGAPSVRCSKGWLHVYHAANVDHQYCLGVFMASLEDPGKIISRSRQPILTPIEPYERIGFFRDVVFACGVLLVPHVEAEGSPGAGDVEDGNSQLVVYYGAADDKVAMCSFRLCEIYRMLQAQ